jgi:hypothetical protein
MPETSLDSILAAGEHSLEEAREAREALRKVTEPGDESREFRLAEARTLIDDAMVPIRSLIGKLIWEPRPAAEERALRDLSKRLGAERRRIKKMQRS